MTKNNDKIKPKDGDSIKDVCCENCKHFTETIQMNCPINTAEPWERDQAFCYKFVSKNDKSIHAVLLN